jgi:hypothetical protein
MLRDDARSRSFQEDEMKKGLFSGFAALFALTLLFGATTSVLADPPKKSGPAKYVLVTGTIELDGIEPTAPPQSVTITLLGLSEPMQYQVSVTPGSPVQFLMRPGDQLALVRGGKWLAQRVEIHALGRGASFSVTLPGGDANGDNRVDWTDVDILADAYISQPGDANWDDRADVDCDGDVDDYDADLIFDNLDRFGH